MKIITELYSSSLERLPKSGQFIFGHQTENSIVVYQAYKNSIADFSVKNQILGGPDFSYNRMSWIKPNFLWMMFRCGWAQKENQERILALWIDKDYFVSILDQAVLSSFNSKFSYSHEQWKKDLNSNEVRLQWDPDHDPFGNKIKRRAIQLGLKGNVLEEFGKQKITLIEDVTDFVKAQKKFVDRNNLEELLVPIETVFIPSDIKLNNSLGIE